MRTRFAIVALALLAVLWPAAARAQYTNSPGTTSATYQVGGPKGPNVATSPQITTLTFQPGGTASGNRYPSWLLLFAAANAVTGPVKVFFDCSIAACALPSGAWAFTATSVEFVGDLEQGTQVDATGATLSGVDRFSLIELDNTGTAPVITISSGDFEAFFDSAVLFATSTGPLISVTGTGTTAELSFIHGCDIGDHTHAALSGGTGSFLTVNLLGGSIAEAGSISGAGTQAVDAYDTGVTNNSSIATTLKTNASLLAYDDTIVSPTISEHNVQDAIDYLKSHSSGGGGITQLTGDGTAGPGSGSQALTIANLAVSKLAHGTTGTLLITNGTTPTWTGMVGDGNIGPTGSLTVTGIRSNSVPSPSGTNTVLQWSGSAFSWATPSGGTSVTGTGLWYSASGTLNAASVGLSLDASLGALSGGNLPITITGLRGSALPSLTAGYLNYTGSAWALTALPTALPPNGAAGGRLTGTYPNPTLSASGVATGACGDSSHVGVATYSADGTVSACTATAIAPPVGAATGTLPLANLTHGTAGQFLVTNAGATAPAWATPAGDLTCSTGTPGSCQATSLSSSSPIPVTPALQWVQGATSPGLSQAQQATASAPVDMTDAPQAPSASAATTANGTPASRYVNTAVPVSTGVEAFWGWKRNSVFEVGFSYVSSSPILYMGAGLAPSTTNYTLWAFGGTTYVGSPSANVAFRPGGAANSGGAVTGNGWQFGNETASFDGGVKVLSLTDATTLPTAAATSGHATLYSDSHTLETNGAGFQFHRLVSTPLITQVQATTDVATQKLKMVGQAAFASATGSNKNTQRVDILDGNPASGGTHGGVLIGTSDGVTTVSATSSTGVQLVGVTGAAILGAPGNSMTEVLGHPSNSGASVASQAAKIEPFSNFCQSGSNGGACSAAATTALASGKSATIYCHALARVTTAGGGMSLTDSWEGDVVILVKNIAGTVSQVGATTLHTALGDTTFAGTTAISWNNSGTTLGCSLFTTATGGAGATLDDTVTGEVLFN